MNKATAVETTIATWRDALATVDDNPLWSKWREPAVLRSLIVALNTALDETPDFLLQEFDQFDETVLATTAQCLTGHLGARQRCDAVGSDVDVLRHAVTVLRALDMVLEESTESIPDEAPECWLDLEKATYVVPIPRAAMSDGGARTQQHFGRRGLLRHRIIPRAIGGTEIQMKVHNDVTPVGVPIERIVGAALFEDFSLDYDPLPDRKFVVTAVDCAGGIEAAIERHCAAARKAGCDTIVWPELTIDPVSAARIAAHLQDIALDTVLPSIVVTGSWHVLRGDERRNMATVYDGRGTFLFEFAKNLRFTFGGLTEDIAVHPAIHVLATDRELVAFAICKDFCGKAKREPPPARQLDVDLVLVPSMGQWNTMTSHRDAADDMRIWYGTRTAVVQQLYPRRDDDPPGFVLRLPDEPRSKERADLVARLEFTTFQREDTESRSATRQSKLL